VNLKENKDLLCPGAEVRLDVYSGGGELPLFDVERLHDVKCVTRPKCNDRGRNLQHDEFIR
jgi:hypothetical protein